VTSLRSCAMPLSVRSGVMVMIPPGYVLRGPR